MTDKNQRHSKMGLKIPQSCCVVGCGGGMWVALGMAHITKKIVLFDDDYIELHNLNRLPVSEEKVGTGKVDALVELLQFSECEVQAFPCKFDPDLLSYKPEVLFDCTDNFKSQKEIYKWCRINNVKYIKVGCKGNHITVVSGLPDFDSSSDNEQCGVEIQQWVATQMVVAGMAIMKACLNIEDVSVELTELTKQRR